MKISKISLNSDKRKKSKNPEYIEYEKKERYTKTKLSFQENFDNRVNVDKNFFSSKQLKDFAHNFKSELASKTKILILILLGLKIKIAILTLITIIIFIIFTQVKIHIIIKLLIFLNFLTQKILKILPKRKF